MFTILATAQNSQMSNNEATAAAMGGFAGLLMGEFLLIFCVILLVCLAFGIWLLWLICSVKTSMAFGGWARPRSI